MEVSQKETLPSDKKGTKQHTQTTAFNHIATQRALAAYFVSIVCPPDPNYAATLLFAQNSALSTVFSSYHSRYHLGDGKAHPQPQHRRDQSRS